MDTPPEPTPAERVPDGPVHLFFGLSYASYFVIPRCVLQSMPLEWQERFVALMNEADDMTSAKGVKWPPPGTDIYVNLKHHENGRFCKDDFASYERGRRRLW